MKNINVFNHTENKNVELQMTMLFPYKEGNIPQINHIGYAMDVIGQFSSYIIRILEERIDACTKNLIRHYDDIIFNNGLQIVYKRKDGTFHSFNTPSMQAMHDAIITLKKGNYRTFVEHQYYIDQTIKAIMNSDSEKPEDKSGYFKFSDLVSVLCTTSIIK